MDKQKINQVDAAKGIGLDRSRFNLLLNDKVGSPRRETLLKISDFFRCDLEWLISGKGEPYPQSEIEKTGDMILNGNGNIQAGGFIRGKVSVNNHAKPESETQAGKTLIALDDDEKELIFKLRDVGGKITLRKFLKELDRIKKLLDDEI